MAVKPFYSFNPSLRLLQALFHLLLISCFTVFAANAQEQPYKFEHLDALDGLSHNKVQCILQDRDGFIWFGTVYGLNRYDGYSFKVFENIPGDSLSLGNNNIISLYQDKGGTIWVGTSTILSSYNPKTECFTNYSLPGLKGWIHDFAEHDALLWIATANGLFSFDPTKKQAQFHKTGNGKRENIHGILKDPKDNGILWLSAETGIRKYNTGNGSVKQFLLPEPAFNDISREITHNIISDSNGNIWMSTSSLGICKLDIATETLTRYSISLPPPASVQTAISTQLMRDSDGKIWIGTEGLAIFDPGTGNIKYPEFDAGDEQGLRVRVRALLKDKNGIYWIGTERGVALYNPKLYSFTTIKPNYPYTLQSANTIIEDNDHTFWVGNYLGLGTMDPATGVYKERNDLLGYNNTIYASLMDRDGSLWFTSEGRLFHLFKDRNRQLRSAAINIPGNTTIQARCAAFDAAHILWIGTRSNGIFRYDPAQKTFMSYVGDATDPDLLTTNAIGALYAISGDSLLIGTKGSGLMLMHTKTGKFDQIKFSDNEAADVINNSIINVIYTDRSKRVWIGTESGGLWQTNTALSEFRNYSIKDGLQSMNITQITEDDKGQIWLNASLGLEIIDPRHNRFVHYSARDGLGINQTDYLIRKSSGDLLRVDFNGLHIFHSSSINLNKEVPPVYITHMQILNKVIPIYKDTVIRLKYEENYLSFEYVALNYTQSYKNRYSYYLEGLDKKWVDAGDRRFATYANIAPGTYTFYVKAANNNGVWNETGAKVTFIIAQPWWGTWWFYTAAAALVVAVIYIVFRLRLQQEIKAMEVRNKISRDLHDEVGSTLSSIGFLSSMALGDLDSSNTKVYGTLNNINESSTRMLDAMSDIIWNIQPKNDTVENIIARMISFASEILEAKKINLHIHIAENISHLHIGLYARHDFYMIFKEAINNLAKYSSATEAWVNLELKHSFLHLSIRDNGKGFDKDKVKNGNGLRNMYSRAQKIGAFYELQTEPDRGTTIILEVKPS